MKIGQDIAVVANDYAGASAVEHGRVAGLPVLVRFLALALLAFLFELPAKLFRHQVPEWIVTVVKIARALCAGDFDDDDRGGSLLCDFDERIVELARQIEGWRIGGSSNERNEYREQYCKGRSRHALTLRAAPKVRPLKISPAITPGFSRRLMTQVDASSTHRYIRRHENGYCHA
jgi:hypothetical protein